MKDPATVTAENTIRLIFQEVMGLVFWAINCPSFEPGMELISVTKKTMPTCVTGLIMICKDW